MKKIMFMVIGLVASGVSSFWGQCVASSEEVSGFRCECVVGKSQEDGLVSGDLGDSKNYLNKTATSSCFVEGADPGEVDRLMALFKLQMQKGWKCIDDRVYGEWSDTFFRMSDVIKDYRRDGDELVSSRALFIRDTGDGERSFDLGIARLVQSFFLFEKALLGVHQGCRRYQHLQEMFNQIASCFDSGSGELMLGEIEMIARRQRRQ